jgi:hypothetical protein
MVALRSEAALRLVMALGSIPANRQYWLANSMRADCPCSPAAPRSAAAQRLEADLRWPEARRQPAVRHLQEGPRQAADRRSTSFRRWSVDPRSEGVRHPAVERPKPH